MSATLLQLAHVVMLALANRSSAPRATRRPDPRSRLERVPPPRGLSAPSGFDGNIDTSDPSLAKAQLYYSHRLGELTRILARDASGGRRHAACQRHAVDRPYYRGNRRSVSPNG